MKVKRKAFVFYGLHIGTALLLGLLIYLFCGRNIRILRLAGQWLPLDRLPEAGPGMVSRFARNYLCDMAWAYALVFAVYLFTGEEGNLGKLSAGCMIFAVITEWMQLAGFLSGTFDIWDIVLEGLAVLMAAFLIKRHKEKRGGFYEKEYENEDSGYGGAGSVPHDGGRERIHG